MVPGPSCASVGGCCILQHMEITVPVAARRVGRNPETVRRWIRAGKLASRRVGTQHLIQESDLGPLVDAEAERLPIPDDWRLTDSGAEVPNLIAMLRRQRAEH
ncbi:MAG: DNA-binding protein [Chloroflexota bacterium]|nr:MAG: DNA-binding protein [Chloroflexota bacterium]